MPKYLFTADYTPAGIAGLQKEGGTGRRDMFAAMFEGLGGSMESFYYGFGGDDLYISRTCRTTRRRLRRRWRLRRPAPSASGQSCS